MIWQTILIVFVITYAGVARAEMPQELVQMLAGAEVPSNARAEIEAGKAAVWVLERNSGAEQVTVGGVVKLAKPPRQVADDFFGRDSLIEGDILKASGTFSEPAVLSDVAGYSLPDSDLEVLADCEVHACKFKLGEQGLKELEAIDWEAPDARSKVDALARRRIVDFVATYQKEGRAALGRYVDKANARSVPEATGILLNQMNARVLLDTVRAHLADYPKKVRGARDRLHWNVRDYGYRPVTSIVHTVAFNPDAGEPAAIVAAETLYSSHYFDARLQLLGLYTDTEDPNRTYAVYGDRLLFDDKVGSVQRKFVRSGIVDDVRKRLTDIAAR